MFFFLSVKSPIVLSLFTKLWIVCLLGTLSLRNFRQHFLADPYFTWVTYRNTHVLKYTTPWCTTLHTNCSWEQMANGADNCCLQLKNPHCLPCNIILSSGSQVNYFPSFQTLSVLRHADSPAKFVCTLQQCTGRREVQSHRSGPHTKNPSCICSFLYAWDIVMAE
jgi:hypothetical protein